MMAYYNSTSRLALFTETFLYNNKNEMNRQFCWSDSS